MLCLAVYEDGVYVAVGVPNVIFSDDDLKWILSNENALRDIVAKFGEGVTIGRLGTLADGGYVEEEAIDLELDTFGKGDLGFYEKL